ncbi:MAG: hypothetical protein IOD12_12950 [Silvanigrellales bacterium]|nr:hypothetical protein [Silvanigrellales bacterium]
MSLSMPDAETTPSTTPPPPSALSATRKREVLAAFEGPAQLPELLSAAFGATGHMPQVHVDRLIVGGGLTGLLLALRLSAGDPKEASNLCLVEGEQACGGRLFFSTPWHGMGSPRSRFEMLIERGFLGRDVSGPGFEAFSPDALTTLERHLVATLSDEERSFVEAFTCMGTEGAPLSRRCYVVKKEVTPLSAHLDSSTEILTRKEAEALGALVNLLPHEDTVLAETIFWKELPKATRENLTPLLETLCGFNFSRFFASHVAMVVHGFLDAHKVQIPPLLRRDGGLELALELVLRMRGVQVRTSTRVVRLERGEAASKSLGSVPSEPFRLLVGDDAFPSARELTARQVTLCLPLARTLTLLPREALSPGQGKLVSKHRPRSLVALEFPNVADNCLGVFPEECRPGDVLFFPVERARGHVTSQGSLVLGAWLEFEESLQAPSVREALSRLRKAAARVLKPEALRVFSQQGAAVPAGSLTVRRERVVLLPVGLATPQEPLSKETVGDVRTAWKGLTVCGDGFTWSATPWRNVVNSVAEASGNQG